MLFTVFTFEIISNIVNYSILFSSLKLVRTSKSHRNSEIWNLNELTKIKFRT